MYICFHVKYTLFLSDFNKTWIFRADFRKNTQMPNFMKIRRVGAELLYADTYMMKLRVASQFYERAW